MSGTSPQSTSITLSLASGAVIRTSAPRAICRPPPKHVAVEAATTGIGRSIQSVHDALHAVRAPALLAGEQHVVERDGAGHQRREVQAGAEARAVAVEHDGADAGRGRRPRRRRR